MVSVFALSGEQVNFQWDDDDDEVRFVLDQHTELDIYSASSLKQQSRVDMSSHSNTLSWFRANQSLLFLLNAVCLVEKKSNKYQFYSLWFQTNFWVGIKQQSLTHSLNKYMLM
jgi:hypothetical protein